MTSRSEGRARPIAWPIFALVIASVLLATAVYFVVTFNGPPPMEPPRSVEGIARLLKTGRQPGDPGPPMRLSTSAAAPVASGDSRDDPTARARLAAQLGAAPADVVAFTGDRGRRFALAYMGDYTFGWRQRDGRWRVVRNAVRPTFLRWHWVTLGAMLATILALAIPAWALAQAIARPLRALADAAGAARASVALPPLPRGGSREVRALGQAVGDMHARLAGHAQGRTAMLAAIAHDLGTPLSRLAFRAEQLPEASRVKAAADIEEMRAMIASALRFARDELIDGSTQRLDLGSLIDSLVADMADTGAAVTIDPGPRVVMRGDAGALRRLFQNLIDNALRYGGQAAVGWTVAGSEVAVTIDDAGPGIDPALVDQLFEPFVRGDPSRNRATGGTGLGLAIVRSIAARHGGEVVLANRDDGVRGARARVALPVSG